MDRIKNTLIRLPILHNEDGSIYIDASKKYSDTGYVPDFGAMRQYIKSLHYKPLTTKNKRANIFFHSRFAVPSRSLFTSFRPVFQDTSAVLSAFPVRQPRLRCNRSAGGERGTGNGYSSKHGMGRPVPYEPAGRISRGKNLSGMFIPESKNRKPGTEEFISTLHAGLCYADLQERLADASHYD